LIQQVVNNILKPQRIQIEKESKEQVLERQEHLCNVCSCELGYYEMDHIIPLASNGTNDIDNLQALCKQCHFDKTSSEIENSEYVYIHPFASAFNNATCEIMNGQLAKRYAFIERIGEVPAGKKAYYFDINKCRRNSGLYLNDKISVFTCMDDPVEFDVKNEIVAGEYYVESDNYLPLRGNGWYSHVMIKFCLENNIILKTDIKYVLRAQLSIEANKFQQVLNTLAELPGLGKQAPNMFFGLQNQKTTTTEKHFYTFNYKQACSEYMRNEMNDCVLKPIKLDKEARILYDVISREVVELEMVNTVVYNTILDKEAIELYKLKKAIEKRGGHVTFYNTDCCECYFDGKGLPFRIIEMDKKLNVEGFYWDDENKHLK
jgi:hypothetical protein